MEIQDPVVRAMATYISSAAFQRQFEQFFLDNALTFTDELEHQLEYMTIYIAFQHKFNEHMEGFLAEQGVAEDEFAARCQKAIQSDPKAEQYLDIVLASMDYDAFYSLMKVMRSRASIEASRADAKDGGDHDECGAKGGSGKRKAVDGADVDKDEGFQSKASALGSARDEVDASGESADAKHLGPSAVASKESDDRSSKGSK